VFGQREEEAARLVSGLRIFIEVEVSRKSREEEASSARQFF
jgi:hypothetical protein